MAATLSRAVLPDDVLIERALTGSKDSFDMLYERHFPRVYGFVSRRVRDAAEAEDVVQEIFIQAMTHLGSYRAQSTFLHWMYGITRNVLKRYYTRQSRTREDSSHRRVDVNDSPDTLQDGITPERLAMARQQGQRTAIALESLDPQSRELFRLHHLEGVSIRDLSERTLRSEDSIKSDLYRIRRRISDEE